MSISTELYPIQDDPATRSYKLCIRLLLFATNGFLIRSPQEESQEGNQGGERRNENLDSWLPITSCREGKWWYSAFHNVTAMVGAGVLGLPYATSQLGWIPGISAIAASWLITLYTLWQLVELHEVVPGTRYDRYPDLGKYVFGPRLGYWIVMPQQMTVQIASDIVYMVTGGKSLKKFIDLFFPTLSFIRQTYYIIFFGCIQLCLSQTPNFNSLKIVSLLAAVMSISYSMIASVASIIKGVHRNESPNYGVRSTTDVGIMFDVFSGLGTIAFAFAGHSVVLEIQATIPSTPEKPSNKPMWRGVVTAYLIVALCYFSVAISGFWAYGNIVEDDVLVSLEHPNWLIAIANLMVFFHVLGSYQVFAMPVFDAIESCLVTKLSFTPGLPLRMTARSVYVVFTALIGVMVPFFGGLLGFFGGLVFAPTSFFIPCIMWLIIHKPKTWSKHWFVCWIAIIFGVSIMLLAPIGGLRELIISAKSYKLFS